MPSIDQRLVFGEHISYRGRLHWIVLVVPIVVAALFGVAALLLLALAVIFWMDNEAIQSAFLTGIVVVQVAVWIIFLSLMRRALAEIAITNRRVVLKSGRLIKGKATELALREIQSVDIRQGRIGTNAGLRHDRGAYDG